jgi:hypothetical protein
MNLGVEDILQFGIVVDSTDCSHHLVSDGIEKEVNHIWLKVDLGRSARNIGSLGHGRCKSGWIHHCT